MQISTFRINKTTFRIKTGRYLYFITPEVMKLLESTRGNITKAENIEKVAHLEITEVALLHCNIVNNAYQEYSRVLYKFVPNKSFG